MRRWWWRLVKPVGTGHPCSDHSALGRRPGKRHCRDGFHLHGHRSCCLEPHQDQLCRAGVRHEHRRAGGASSFHHDAGQGYRDLLGHAEDPRRSDERGDRHRGFDHRHFELDQHPRGGSLQDPRDDGSGTRITYGNDTQRQRSPHHGGERRAGGSLVEGSLRSGERELYAKRKYARRAPVRHGDIAEPTSLRHETDGPSGRAECLHIPGYWTRASCRVSRPSFFWSSLWASKVR